MRLMKQIGTIIAVAGLCVNAWAISFDGNTSGTFQNPTPTDALHMVVAGVGTSSIEWGTPYPPSATSSKLTFDGVTGFGPVGLNEQFLLGTLMYHNSQTVEGTEIKAVDLNVDVVFTLPSGLNETFVYKLTIDNTPNAGPHPSDIVTVNGVPDKTFTFDGNDYSLGVAFETVPFVTPEGGDARAVLLGTITRVPEVVSTLGLLALSALGLGLLRRTQV